MVSPGSGRCFWRNFARSTCSPTRWP
jgi:hypothetical protein